MIFPAAVSYERFYSVTGFIHVLVIVMVTSSGIVVGAIRGIRTPISGPPQTF